MWLSNSLRSVDNITTTLVACIIFRLGTQKSIASIFPYSLEAERTRNIIFFRLQSSVQRWLLKESFVTRNESGIFRYMSLVLVRKYTNSPVCNLTISLLIFPTKLSINKLPPIFNWFGFFNLSEMSVIFC